MKHIAPSKSRITMLGDYLVSVSKSIAMTNVTDGTAAARGPARSRFVILLMLNDVLHADKYHQRIVEKRGIFAQESISFITQLVELAASCIPSAKSPDEKRLKALLNYWSLNRLVDPQDIKTLQDRAEEAFIVAQGGQPTRRRHYLLPEYHGDRNAPWHELPASYMLDPLIRRPDQPIDPSRIKIIKYDGKRASDRVCGLLDEFFENVDLRYTPTGDNQSGETNKHTLSLDPMGFLVKRDKETGKETVASTSYGWSTKFCRDMQQEGVPETIRVAREQAKKEEEYEAGRDQTFKRRDDRRYSPSPRRRRRSSTATSHTRERRVRDQRQGSRSSIDSRDSRSRSRHLSRSPRRSASRPDQQDTKAKGDSRRYEDRNRDQQPPPRPYGRDISSPGTGWIDPGMSQRNTAGSLGNKQFQITPQHPGQMAAHGQQLPLVPPPPFPGQFPMQAFPPPPFQPGGFPGGVPPPPPPNFSGPYPPPPPPAIAAMPNNPYAWNNNQGGNGYGDNVGYNNNNQNYNQTQGNVQGGRANFRGNFQGGGNNRGGYNGSQQGQRSGRWH